MRALLALVLLGGLLRPAPARAEDEASAWTVDQRGRRFRVAFDPGDRLDLGQVSGAFTGGENTLAVGLVRGEAMIDLLRSPHPGRFVTVGAVGFYDLAVTPSDLWPAREHVVAPLTAAALSARTESGHGLLVASGRLEW